MLDLPHYLLHCKQTVQIFIQGPTLIIADSVGAGQHNNGITEYVGASHILRGDAESQNRV